MPSEPDYRTPSPDLGHEAIRAPLARAIDDLSMSYDLVDTLFLLLDSALLALDVAAAERAQHSDRLADLETRIAALEPQPEPTPDPEPTEPDAI